MAWEELPTNSLKVTFPKESSLCMLIIANQRQDTLPAELLKVLRWALFLFTHINDLLSVGTWLLGLADPVWQLRSGRFGLADSVWSFRSEPFRSEPFWSRDVSVLSFRFRDISVRLWNLAEILHFHYLMQTCLNHRKCLFKKKLQNDPRSNSWSASTHIFVGKSYNHKS